MECNRKWQTIPYTLHTQTHNYNNARIVASFAVTIYGYLLFDLIQFTVVQMHACNVNKDTLCHHFEFTFFFLSPRFTILRYNCTTSYFLMFSLPFLFLIYFRLVFCFRFSLYCSFVVFDVNQIQIAILRTAASKQLISAI